MIEIKAIDAQLLREMLNAGAALLEKNIEAVNALNVFPVPDGDTGTNMSMTMMSAVREANSHEFQSVSDAINAIAKGALRGARGNSGVILSQLYRGFAKSLDGKQVIEPSDFVFALKQSAEEAYKAVMKPKEGTILTVARVIAEEVEKQMAVPGADFELLFNVLLSSGEKILAQTQEMLPVLKQAGVVDAGGRGLLLVYTGYAAVLRGEDIDTTSIDISKDVQRESAEFVDDHDAIDEIVYAYCTEFFVQNLKPSATESDISSLRRKLMRLGDCVLVVGDLSLVKVHVHTNDPGKALQHGLAMGELVGLKIENMVQQRRDNIAKKQLEEKNSPASKYGFVSVSLGEGFSNIFKDLGVNSIVDGGQTMNPSIEDIQKAVDSVKADNVFILPNNGNIFLAAKQVADLSDRNIIVLPTKNVAMGIAAIVAFHEDASPEENEEMMNEAAQRVRTGTITYAVRDSEMNDLHIKEGSIIGLNNGIVTSNCGSIDEVAIDLMNQIVTGDDSLITVYYGEGRTEEDAQSLAKTLQDKYDFLDVDVQHGGQPLYYYLISVE